MPTLDEWYAAVCPPGTKMTKDGAAAWVHYRPAGDSGQDKQDFWLLFHLDDYEVASVRGHDYTLDKKPGPAPTPRPDEVKEFARQMAGRLVEFDVAENENYPGADVHLANDRWIFIGLDDTCGTGERPVGVVLQLLSQDQGGLEAQLKFDYPLPKKGHHLPGPSEANRLALLADLARALAQYVKFTS